MDLQKIFEEQRIKAQEYIKLQDKGYSSMEAAYKVFGAELGDEMVKLRQHEIIINTNNN